MRKISLVFLVSVFLVFSAMSAFAADVDISGAIEIQLGSVEEDGVTNEDLVTATVALGFDAAVNDKVDASITLLWEEDDTDPINVDEAFINMKLGDTPAYLKAGLFVVNFGQYESGLLTDPITLDIGEAGQSTVSVGYETDNFNVAAGVFNGDVQETSDTEESVNVFYASAGFTVPEGSLGSVNLSGGASYISSIVESDGLEGAVTNAIAMTDLPGGVAVFAVAEMGKHKLSVEYVTALDEFAAGDLTFAVDSGSTPQAAKPQAWNIEYSIAPWDKWEFAVRYEGSKDLYDFAPEQRHGGAFHYSIYENTTLSFEAMSGKFDEDNDAGVKEVTSYIGQLAVEF